jgi:hypothetical protein
VAAVAVLLVELVAQAAVVILEHLLRLELQTQAVVGVAIQATMLLAVQAAQVSSSSRPINNEDKWKLRYIGCMESTPQCTC